MSSSFQQKNYVWGKFLLYNELAGGIVGFLLAGIASLRRDDAGYFVALIFLIISVLSFLHFYYMLKNKIYVEMTSDGMRIFPRFFAGQSKVVKWSDISNVKITKKEKMFLHLSTGKNVTIALKAIGKEERGEFVKTIKENISRNKGESEEKMDISTHLSSNKKNENKDEILPESYICPNCYEELELDKSERTAKKFTCPSCNNVIDLTKNKKERNEQSEESKGTISQSSGISTKIPVENIVEGLRKNPPEKELCYVVLFGDRPLTAKAQNDEDSIMCFTQRNKAEDFIQGYTQYYQTTKPLTVLAIGQLAELWAMLHNKANDELYEPPYAMLINFNYSGQSYNMYTKLDLIRFGFKGFQKGFNLFLK